MDAKGALASLLSVVALLASPAHAAEPPKPVLREIAAEVSAERLHGALERLVGFGTRHTLSDTNSPTRGIGAARNWTAAQFQALARACGGCLEIVRPNQTVTGVRVPNPTAIEDVIAIQRGTSDPDRVIVISAHIDSRVSDVMNATADAPGANDDGSGVAAVLEAARVLSTRKFPATLVFAVLSGEEQNLYGGKVLADYAAAHGWRVEADLNNDIVGNSHAQDGTVDTTHVRIFSEGTKAQETAAEAARRRINGGETDSPSRNLARFMADMADRYLTRFQVRLMYRADRYGRGSDQLRMLEAGYPAVRVTEAGENYTRQHQDLRTENGVAYGDVIAGVDFPYLAQVTRLNAVTMAALALAPASPAEVKIEGAVTPDTRLSWSPSAGAAAYRAWWRATDAAHWDHSREAGPATTITLPGVNIDDWFFGVSAVSPDGFASPVEFPGAAGAFFPAPAGAPR